MKCRIIIIIFLLLLITPKVFAEEDSALKKGGKIVKDVALGIIKTPLTLVESTLGFDLGKLVITPTKYEKYLSDVTVNMSVLDGEELRTSKVHDVSEPLENVNSVRIERFGSSGQASSPVIRGMTGSRVLVLIDGIPNNSPSLGEVDFSRIPTAGVDRIEVVRGPFSSLYGADAVGGVINIITKEIPKEASSMISYDGGSWNTHNLIIENGSSLGKFGYSLTANYFTTDGARHHSDHTAFDISSKAKIDIMDEVDYTLRANYFLAETDHPGAQPPILLADRTPTQKILGNEDASSLFDYSHTKRFDLNSTLKIKNFTASHYLSYWNDDSHRETISFNNNFDRLIDNDDYTTYIYGMEYKYVQPIMDINTITAGTSFTRKVFKVSTQQYNENAFTMLAGGRDDTRREWAIFAENELKLDPFTIVCGLRRDDPSDYRTRWSPRVSGMIDLGFDTKLRASYARAYKAPTLNDINWPQDAFAEGNETLNPEKTQSWEVSAEKVFKDLFLFKATLFRQRIQDAIVWAPAGTRVNLGWFSYARWTPSNLNKVSNKGIELESRIKLFNDIEARVDYTYIDSEEVSTAQRDWNDDTLFSEARRPSAYIPKHKLYAGMDWKNPFGIKNLALNTSMRYVSERRNYYAAYGTFPNTAISYPKKILAHYYDWDAGVSYKYKDVDIFFAANNILDAEYGKFGSVINDRDYTMPGRSFTGGFSIKH